MTVTDPIADLLTRIRNAAKARKEIVHSPYSKQKEAVAKVLKENGYVRDVKTVGEKATKELIVELYEDRTDITMKKVSKPGQRIYLKSKDIPKVLEGLGLAVISTPKGVMSGKKAKKEKVGGEYLCEVY